MRRTIAVVIDANAKTCGKCAMSHRNLSRCNLFGEWLEEDDRCPACLAAEQKHKEATK